MFSKIPSQLNPFDIENKLDDKKNWMINPIFKRRLLYVKS